jgi:hypothetical protein
VRIFVTLDVAGAAAVVASLVGTDLAPGEGDALTLSLHPDRLCWFEPGPDGRALLAPGVPERVSWPTRPQDNRTRRTPRDER